ncbi:hypothetical protein [Agromyces allii]|uniref:DUF4190 domain-containing protein n=1 Tax=Agromyces allii TaxID=393607 RepID=A0ABN2QC33_9MICO|nr:hypothetical protein [Agromyces allii]
MLICLIALTWTSDAGGWVMTTLGVTSAALAIDSGIRRKREFRTIGVLAVLGTALGMLGTAICLWTVAASFGSGMPAAPHLDFGPFGVQEGAPNAPVEVGASQERLLPYTETTPVDGGCAAGTTCWAWDILPGEACAIAVAHVGFADAVDGAAVMRETRTLADLVPGETRRLVIEDDGHHPALAGIERIVCSP